MSLSTLQVYSLYTLSDQFLIESAMQPFNCTGVHYFPGKLYICSFQKIVMVLAQNLPGAEDLVKMEDEHLAAHIKEANVYDVQTLMKYIDLASEIFNTSHLDMHVKFSRISPSVMNRRSIATAASDMMDDAAAYRRSVLADEARRSQASRPSTFSDPEGFADTAGETGAFASS